MISVLEKSKCSGCHACVSICPKNCIKMVVDHEGFWYPVVGKSKCIGCGICDKICPMINNSHNQVVTRPLAYAAFNKNEEVRLKSSSGGMFTVLAEYVIDQGGIVFGACFNEQFEVVHDYAETDQELKKFRGSKYVQSNVANTFQLVEVFLKKGKLVLFTGTPCQIAGLYSYLQAGYENLLTQDIICHGVPSPKLWDKYMRYREKLAGSRVNKISFRDKTYGWQKYSMQIEYANSTKYCRTNNEDLYLQAFSSNICLRLSCYDCGFKNLYRQADITLADFWGIDEIAPEMNDGRGVSLVIVNSMAGKELFASIQESITFKEVDMIRAIKSNSAMIQSAKLPKFRQKFLLYLEQVEFNRLVKKYATHSLGTRVIRAIVRVLRKIRQKFVVRR